MSTPTDPADLWTQFTYVPGALPLDAARSLIGGLDVGFTPVSLTIQVHGEDPVTVPPDDAAWDRLLETDGAYGLSLDTGENHARPYLQLEVHPTGTEVSLRGAVPPPELLDRLVAHPGLLTGVRGDFEDATWQGETDPEHYRMWFTGEWQHLPRTTDKRGRERIDVSGNPGRITDVLGVVLWAAQDTWLGHASALLIDHDAVPSLPVGTVEDLGGGTFHVRLWQDGATVDDVRRAQQAFRDTLRIDEAPALQEAALDALTADQPADPMFLVQEGAFPHGGVRRFVQYFSASRHPTVRSRAAWLVLDEFGADRQQVHHEEVDLSSGPHPDL